MYKVYKNDVYPFCLIVGKMDDLDEINKEYENWDRKDIEPVKNSEATTYTVYRKKLTTRLFAFYSMLLQL